MLLFVLTYNLLPYHVQYNMAVEFQNLQHASMLTMTNHNAPFLAGLPCSHVLHHISVLVHTVLQVFGHKQRLRF